VTFSFWANDIFTKKQALFDICGLMQYQTSNGQLSKQKMMYILYTCFSFSRGPTMMKFHFDTLKLREKYFSSKCFQYIIEKAWASEGECRGVLAPTVFQNCNFPIYVLVEKFFSLSFEMLKWNFIIVYSPWKNSFVYHLEKSFWRPSESYVEWVPKLKCWAQ